jgi:hypothetical protein
MTKPAKRAKSKAPSNPDFDAIRLWHQMETANYSFEVLDDAISSLIKRKLSDHAPEYYALAVGIVCIYARPFTNNVPVGKLSEEIVPVEFKGLHENLMTIGSAGFF